MMKQRPNLSLNPEHAVTVTDGLRLRLDAFRNCDVNVSLPQFRITDA